MVHIRTAKPRDEEQLFALVRTFPTPTVPDLETFAAAFRSKLADANALVAVANIDDLLVGYVSAYSHPTFYAGGQTAFVDELLVDRDWRGQGIGRDLMRVFETWACTRRCKAVSLATRSARGFCERLGYEPRADYYRKYLGIWKV